MREEPAENMSEIGQAGSHSSLGEVGGGLALKRRGRRRVASGAILTRSCRCEGRDPEGEDLDVPQLLCPVCSVRPIVRGRVVAGELIFPSTRPNSSGN